MKFPAFMKLRRQRDKELDEEIRAHLAMATRERVEQGESRAEAAANARREFGSATLVKEVTREMWGWIWLETLLQDLGYGLRQLRRNPGFAAIIIATLAIGIGANTAVFSVVYSVLLKPLPYPHADQLVNLFESNPQKKVASAALTYPDFQEFVRHGGIFSGLAGYQAHDLVLSGLGEPAEVHTMSVTPGIFSVLGIKPMAGRGFIAQDGKRGAAPVVVLSESIWRSRFGANPNIIGQSVDLDKRSFRVVGIMPANFHFSLRASSEDVWIPMVQDPLWSRAMTQPGERFLRVIGRLKGGVSMRQSEAAMNTVSARLRGTFPVQDSGWSVHLEREQSDVVGAAGSALWILFGAVGLILLIACANIANLLLARATSRAREIAVRVALGAGRTRVIRQLLTESALLGLLGGVAGIVVAYWGVQGLRSVLPSSLPRAQDVGVDGWVLVFAFVLSAAATVIFGLAPALFAAGSGFQTSLKEGSGRVGEGGRRRRLRSLLASAEIALAMILLAGAGLLIRSFTRLTAVDPGFNPEHLVTAEISLPQYQYSKPAQWTAFTKELMARLRAQPGLADSATGMPLPIVDGGFALPFNIPGAPPLAPGTSRAADYMSTSPNYFHAMEIPLLRGRFFSPEDSPTSPPVTIINESLAQRYFPDQNPLGRQMVFGLPPVDPQRVRREIVGVVGNVRDVALNKSPGPTMYAPYAQAPFWGAVVVTRSSLSASAVAASIRRVTHQIDKNLPVTNIETLPDALDASLAAQRFRALLLGLFGIIALVLAAVGIFGVMSYSVTRRTHEMGIRVALGATPGGVLRLVLKDSAKLVLLGLVVGMPLALGLARFLSSMLYGVRPADPLTFIGVAILLTLVALLACYVPAHRASKVDPMIALRHE